MSLECTQCRQVLTNGTQIAQRTHLPTPQYRHLCVPSANSGQFCVRPQKLLADMSWAESARRSVAIEGVPAKASAKGVSGNCTAAPSSRGLAQNHLGTPHPNAAQQNAIRLIASYDADMSFDLGQAWLSRIPNARKLPVKKWSDCDCKYPNLCMLLHFYEINCNLF